MVIESGCSMLGIHPQLDYLHRTIGRAVIGSRRSGHQLPVRLDLVVDWSMIDLSICYDVKI